MNSIMQIPDQVAQAILANRKYFHQLDADAKAKNPNMGFVTKPLALDAELQFWNIPDDEALIEFLDGDLLSALYGSDAIDWNAMPPGYKPLLLVLEFERHCAFEGWTAVSNKGETDMAEIIAAYREVGLDDEASALVAVTAAYVGLGDDDHPDFHELLGKAYRSVPNATPDEEDRAVVILKFVRENPALFWRLGET
ncbi:MAG: hypothetical protein SF172_10115 [Burkholderiales bacterium]|nr:hypothetical protein [Burkholderiales bacterium]